MDLQKVLNKFGIGCDIRIILDKWSEPHRIYHNLSHLQDLISQINEDYGNGELNQYQRDKLFIVALFHDIVYEPTSEFNEENSANFFMSLVNEKFDIDIVEIKQMILDTKNHIPSTPLSEKFINYDMKICERNIEELTGWEDSIREEFSMFGNEEYKEGRIIFLEKIINRFPSNMDNILDLMNYVKTKYN